jgi:hypothetical protein
MNRFNELQFRLVILWLLLLVGMILHFNYHVSKIFYGINVARPGSDGTIPLMAHLLKNVYYHVPMLFIVALLYFKRKGFRFFMLVVSVPYTLSHMAHVWDELHKPELNWAQIPLLGLILVFSVMLNKASWDYYKAN